MVNQPPEVVQEVLRVYRKTRNSPFKTSRICAVPVADVFAIVDQYKDKVESAQERYGGEGRPELYPFTVARRKANVPGWDNTDREIAIARANYEAGTHEMVTGRDGAWLILYSIPRRNKAKGREGYFIPEVA